MESPKNSNSSPSGNVDEDMKIMVDPIRGGSASGPVSVRVDDWILRYVRPEARKKLIKIMKKTDLEEEEGFIYCLEIFQDVPDEEEGYSIIKVGRSTNIQDRIKQWGKCSKRSPRLLGIFPKPCKVMRNGQLRPESATPLHAWLDQLVFAELKDIALHSSHLEDDFDPYRPEPGMKRAELRNASDVEVKRHKPRPCPHCTP
ncbi:hypothetical protein FRC03_000063 [Tulasnella sp. 419]|nr:hypothetical protein FRC03_000063 [Tulasnella sp. 419]